MRALSRCLPLLLSSSLPPSLPLTLRSISLLPSSLLAQPLFLPLVPSNRTSLDIPTVRCVGRAASRCFSAHRAFFSSLSLFLSSSSPFLPPSPTLLAILVLPARARERRRERLARNSPQNKRVSRRVASQPQSRSATRAPTLPCIFNYRLVTESLD